jgi:hypothetical protein
MKRSSGRRVTIRISCRTHDSRSTPVTRIWCRVLTDVPNPTSPVAVLGCGALLPSNVCSTKTWNCRNVNRRHEPFDSVARHSRRAYKPPLDLIHRA